MAYVRIVITMNILIWFVVVSIEHLAFLLFDKIFDATIWEQLKQHVRGLLNRVSIDPESFVSELEFSKSCFYYFVVAKKPS